MSQSAPYPLEGLKVLDFSRVLAGPFATRMLSDLGADVLKIEPPEGDTTRAFGLRQGEMSGFYLQQNIGKRNVCLDLKAEGARELVYKLAAEADVVVENFRPGVMDRFKVGWDNLKEVNPALIMVSISGFGQVGPERDRAAYAGVLHAETGLIDRQNQWVGGHPADIQYSIADTYTGLHGLVAMFAALRLRDRTGQGQHIDMAMFNALHATDDFANYALDEVWPLGNENRVWLTANGDELYIAGDLKWLWHVFSRAEGLTDPSREGASLAQKVEARLHVLTDHFKSYPDKIALQQKLDELRIAWGNVRKFGADAYASPSIDARRVLVEVTDYEGRKRRTTQSPYRFSDASAGISSDQMAPRRGEHNEEALADWVGLSSQEVGALKEAGILLADESE